MSNKKAKYLNIYPEDFEKYNVWKDICDSLNISYDCKGVTILYTEVEVIDE